MLTPSSTAHQTNLFGTDLLQQLDPRDPLLQLAKVIPWAEFDRAFAKHYTQRTGSTCETDSSDGWLAAIETVRKPQ